MKRMKSFDELCHMNNLEMLKWYKELRSYRKDLLNYAKSYYEQVKLVKNSLHQRCNELELEELEASYDRQDSDVEYFNIKTWIH